MQDALPLGVEAVHATIPQALKELIAFGMVDVEGCVCLKSLLGRAHVSRADFPDATGYECFVNHIHLDEYVSTNMIAVGIALLNEISGTLRRGFADRSFQGIIAADESSCALRFHTVRLGEQWLADDLDAYEECICVIDL